MGTLSVSSRQRGRGLEVQMSVPMLEPATRNKCKLIWDSSHVNSLQKKLPKSSPNKSVTTVGPMKAMPNSVALNSLSVAPYCVAPPPNVMPIGSRKNGIVQEPAALSSAGHRRNSLVTEMISFYEEKKSDDGENLIGGDGIISNASTNTVTAVESVPSIPSGHGRMSPSSISHHHTNSQQTSRQGSHQATNVQSYVSAHVSSFSTVSHQSSASGSLQPAGKKPINKLSSPPLKKSTAHKNTSVISVASQPLNAGTQPISHQHSNKLHQFSHQQSLDNKAGSVKFGEMHTKGTETKRARIKSKVSFQEDVVELGGNDSAETKAKIQFADNAITTFEYDDEESALAQYLREHPEEEEEVRRQQEEIERSENEHSPEDLLTDSPRKPEPDSSAMKSNTIIGIQGLANYNPKIAVPDFQFGMTPEPDDYYLRQPESEVEESRDLLPADESELDIFSSEVTKPDMLF